MSALWTNFQGILLRKSEEARRDVEITPEGIADAVGREVIGLVRQIKAGTRTREEAVKIMGELGDAIFSQARKEKP